jgi:hypothetical protein
MNAQSRTQVLSELPHAQRCSACLGSSCRLTGVPEAHSVFRESLESWSPGFPQGKSLDATVKKNLQIVCFPKFNAVFHHNGLEIFFNTLLGVEANGIVKWVLARPQCRRGDVEILLGLLNPFA